MKLPVCLVILLSCFGTFAQELIYDTYLLYSPSTNATLILDAKGDTVLWSADHELFPMDPEESGTDYLHARSPEGKYGLASLVTGSIVIPAIYDSLIGEGYNQFYRYVTYKNGKQCWFDNRYMPLDLDSMSVMTTRELLFDRLDPYEYNWEIDNFLFIVQSPATDKMGIADYSGKMIIQPAYDSIFAYNQGFAAFQDGKWGFLDSTGTLVLPFAYDFIRPHSAELVEVTLSGKKGLRTMGNEEILPVLYDHIELIKGTNPQLYRYYIVSRNGRYGVVKPGGELVVPMKYDHIKWLSTGQLVQLEHGQKFRIYNLELKRAITGKFPVEPMGAYVATNGNGSFWIVITKNGVAEKLFLFDGKELPLPDNSHLYR